MELGGGELEVRPANGKDEIAAAQKLRVRVFAGEQGISAEAEVDGLDAEAIHIVALRRGETVGTCRLRFPGGKCKLERMVVERNLRGRGVGRRLIEAAERVAAARGVNDVVLNAQREAEAFYASCGYIAGGDTFFEQGIPHVQMRKKIATAPAAG